MTILGIETSCDETSAAVVHDGKLVSNVTSTQLFHSQYGGIVPELASRAHLKLIVPIVDQALSQAGVKKSDLDAVAAVYGPGLVGSILVGLSFGKAMAMSLGIPFIGVNHMEGHIFSNLIDEPKPNFPFLNLTVSGGHTQLVLVRNPFEYEVLGDTMDDAAGEAFDKVAKMLGIGYPGGPLVDKYAASGDPTYVDFPRPFLSEGSLEFSFSGLKTAVLYYLRKRGFEKNQPIKDQQFLANVCASFQAAVVDVLVQKVLSAAKRFGLRDIAIAGGVSANSELRRRASESAALNGLRLFLPRLDYCTDNGAMIAMVGYYRMQEGRKSDLELTAQPGLELHTSKDKATRAFSRLKMRRWLLLALGTFLVGLMGMYYIFWLPARIPEPGGRIVTIPRGVSFKAVTDSLAHNGIIRSKFAFEIAGRILGYTKSVKVGKYLFQSSLSNSDILRDINEGKSRLIISVTIPEGWRMEAIAKKFSRDLGVDAARILDICKDSTYAASKGFSASTLEGYLMPETYNFYWQTDEHEIVERMVTGFKIFLVDSLEDRMRQIGMTLHQVLTLASIVEGESGVDAERPTIAGVYLNRLKKRMRLEADPTIQYVLPDSPRRLLYSDLRIESPYNTYLYYGLPPGPVNNPGKQSILGVLYPEKHQYLYFVATGVGGHRFSKSYVEHQKAVRVYRKVRRVQQKNANQSG